MADTIIPEVIPQTTKFNVVQEPAISFDVKTALQSPFFWILVGASVASYFWYSAGKSKRSRDSRD